MNLKLFVNRFLLACIILILLYLAWWAIKGGLQQLSTSNTFGQQVETIIQIVCGLLSLLTIFTIFLWRSWAKPIRMAWTTSLVTTAALSSLVWGPPMPLIALTFGAVALLLALLIITALKRLSIKPGSGETQS